MFWEDCKSFAASFSSLWIMLGDFNDIGDPAEQWGSADVNMNNINRFVETYNGCGLFDLTTVGPMFSWVRQVGGLITLRRKLDRVLWNI